MEDNIYRWPHELFRDLEKKEFIKMERPDSDNCKDCEKEVCSTPNVIVVNRGKMGDYLRAQAAKTNNELERGAILETIDLSEDELTHYYAASYAAHKIRDGMAGFLASLWSSPSID